MFGTLARPAGGRCRCRSLCCRPLPRRTRRAGIIDRMKQKVKDKTDAITDSIADAKIDKATGAVMCAASNSACIKKAMDSGKPVEVVDAKGKRVSAADSAKAVDKAGGVPASAASTSSDAGAGAAPSQGFGDGVLVNYDFVPGDRVIFAEDFARDPIGDFPKRLELRRGNFEVAKWQGQQYLRTNSGGVVVRSAAGGSAVSGSRSRRTTTAPTAGAWRSTSPIPTRSTTSCLQASAWAAVS